MVNGQELLPLYSTGQIPNSIANANYTETVTTHPQFGKIVSKVSVPTLTAYFPKNPNGTAVIVCPGGGYSVLLTEREGSKVAQEFNKLGITAFVLKYRLPDARIMKNRSIGPLQDIQQAMKVVRTNAKKWHIKPHKIGVMGFSAGGHVAATLATHYSDVRIENKEKVNLRPDFALLVFPVISFQDSIAHKDSRDSLLGKPLLPTQIDYFSNEKHVNKHTPPTFITYALDDSVVNPKNSIYYYEALKANNVKACAIVYAKGGHGYLTVPAFGDWFGACTDWMKKQHLLKKKK